MLDTDGASAADDAEAPVEQDFESAFNEFAGGGEKDIPAKALETEEEELQEGEKEEEVAQEDEQPTEQATDDPWKEAPEALRGEFEKLKKDHDYWQHRYQSDVGRVSAYQRQNDELKKQLEQGASREEPTQKEIGDAMESPDKWKEFKEEYPEVAEYLEPIKNQVSGLKQSFDFLKSQLSPLEKAERNRAQEESRNKVAQVHPDWLGIVRDPVFDQWLTQQSPGMRTMANSDDPADVISLVSNFKYWAQQQLATQDAPAKQAGETPASGNAGQSVDAIKQRRAQQLADAQTVTNRGRANENTLPADDFDTAFAVYAKQAERAFS